VAPDGEAALDIGADVKMVKVLKVLNFSGAGKSNIFVVAGDVPHPQPPLPSEPGEGAVCSAELSAFFPHRGRGAWR
jgi:hypothetical protein